MNSNELVFKSSNEAVSSLNAKVQVINSRLVKLNGESKQVALDIISMYMAIISKIQNGNSVKDSAISVWALNKEKFSNKSADQIEFKLIGVIASRR